MPFLPGPGPLVQQPHEPVDAAVAATIGPPLPIVVERERRRESTLVAISINGLYAVDDSAVATRNSLVVALIDERRRRMGLDPIALSGANTVSSGVGVPGTTPPLPQSIDRSDQRVRYRPLDPISINGLLASFAAAPPTLPPGPFVVPIDDRRRFLAALPATISHGYDDAVPPNATVVESVRPRPRTPDPLQLSGVLAPFLPPFTMPPRPVLVIGEDGRLRRASGLDPIVLRGALALFVPVTPIPIYQILSSGGTPTLNTSGGNSTSSTSGGNAGLATSGGTPGISTSGGTPTITTQGPTG